MYCSFKDFTSPYAACLLSFLNSAFIVVYKSDKSKKDYVGKSCSMGVHRRIHAVDQKEGDHFGDLCIKVRKYSNHFHATSWLDWHDVLMLKLPELRRLAQC
jgi:hypothetical protein